MGSGSSSKKGKAIVGQAKYEFAPDEQQGDGGEALDGEDTHHNVRPCDKCGETRKTARFGGATAEWLCAACQLESGATRPRPRRVQTSDNLAPQPLRRGNTASSLDNDAGSRKPPRRPTDGTLADASSSTPLVHEHKRSRRAAKERATVAPVPSPTGMRRANTVSLNVVEDRQDFRSLKGLNELRESIGKSVACSDLDGGAKSPKGEPTPPPPPIQKKQLPGGYFNGDRVASLVSRVRGGILVLEFGHEGFVVGSRGSDEDSAKLRLLVQFDRGFDWFLSPCQICLASALPGAKGSGLARFVWGARVRSLLSYLNPVDAKASIWLGDFGTVIGPGHTPGKLAIRFDDGCGEWNVWTSALTEAETYDAKVAEKIEGQFFRGDRVRASVRCNGSRDGSSAKSTSILTVSEGEMGTIIGPGHASGRILVHFDSDDRVWSLPVGKVSRLAA